MESKDIVIFGIGSFARLMNYYLEKEGKRKVVAFTVEEKYFNESVFEGKEVIPFEDLVIKYPPSSYDIIIGVGYKNMNKLRERIFFECKDKGYFISSYVHNTAIIADNVKLGEGNIILENVVLEPYVNLGKGNLLWANVSIGHDCKIGNFNTFTGAASLSGFVQVENNCFMGNNSTIKDGVYVSNCTLIGAGCYISNNTRENTLYIMPKAKKIILTEDMYDLI